MPAGAISISLGGSLTIVILFTILLVGLAMLFYHSTLPPVPRRRRAVLSVLRSAALVLLLLMLFEPVLRSRGTTVQEPVLAVLLDNSQSMRIRDSSVERGDRIRNFLRRNPFEGHGAPVHAVYFPFSSTLGNPLGNPADSLQFNGEVTDIASALSGVKAALGRGNIQAVVLVSDGNYTAGKNPLYEAQGLGIPVTTIGVGDTSEQKDVLVSQALTNTITYAGTKVPVEVTVRSAGYNGEQVEVILSEGSEALDRTRVVLGPGVREYHLIMHGEMKTEGVKKLVISVSKLPGELTDRNNSRSVFLKVLKSKLRVLLLAGCPQPDVAAVRQCLSEDQHMTVQSYTQKGENEFYEGALAAAALDSSDCLVLVGYPGRMAAAGDLQKINEVILRRHMPLLFINGKNVDPGKLQMLEPVLPFAWTSPGSGEVMVGCVVDEREKHSPLVELEEQSSTDTWQRLPPIFKTQTTYHAKPESEVLAWATIQNIVLREPLALLRNVGRQKSFAITGYGLWRWQLLAQGGAETTPFFKLLLSNVVRWLTTREDEKNVRVVPVKEAFISSEAIAFTGQVYDAELRPLDNAEVRVDLRRAGENLDLPLRGIGNGMYEGSLDGLGEGDYTYEARASFEGRELGVDKGRFSVGQGNAEFLETKLDKQMLEQMAFRTGGKYYDIGETDNLDHDISSEVTFSSKELVHTGELELWNWKYLSIVIVILFAAEWFMRKRSGML